jgi:small subunit ribosomal protein S15
MSITKIKKSELINSYGGSADNTGSVDVQCAILTERIRNLTAHMAINKKDTQAKRGMIMLVSQRRKLLRYLENKSVEKYKELIAKLGIRK